MHYTRLTVFATVLACIALHAAAQTPSNAIDKISAYEGTWKASMTHYATKYSKARTESNTIHNDCWHSGDYVACHQVVNGVPVAFIVYTYDAAKHLYHIHAVPKDGSDSHAGTLSIDGNTWTFPWQDKDGEKTVYLRVVNVFTDAKTIQYREEYSYDNTVWIKVADGVEHRDP